MLTYSQIINIVDIVRNVTTNFGSKENYRSIREESMTEYGFLQVLQALSYVFQDLQVLEVLHSELLKDCLKKWLVVMMLFVMLLMESERLFAGPYAGLQPMWKRNCVANVSMF